MKTNKTSLILLALLYKYVSTGESKLDKWDVEIFIMDLQRSIFDKEGHYPDVNETSIDEEFFYLETPNQYVLKTPVDLEELCDRHIDRIPQNFLKESLKEENLNKIGANRKLITVNTVTQSEKKDLKIFSMSGRDAENSARRALNYYGAKKINIRGSFYLGMKPDHLWNVTASYEMDYIYIDFPGLMPYSRRKIADSIIWNSAIPSEQSPSEPIPDNVLRVKFNDDYLSEFEITKTTRKVRAFVYNPETEEALLVHYDGLYMLPGGSIDENETRETAIIRELLEQTGIEITEEDLTPYLVLDNYDKQYFDCNSGLVNRRTETVFYKVLTTKSIDETKKKLTDSKKHSVEFVSINNMKNIVESNDTDNYKRKQFDREILTAINAFLDTLTPPETPVTLMKK